MLPPRRPQPCTANCIAMGKYMYLDDQPDFADVGAWRSSSLRSLRAAMPAIPSLNTLDMATGHVCTGDECAATVVVECMTVGQLPCEPDANGNYGVGDRCCCCCHRRRRRRGT